MTSMYTILCNKIWFFSLVSHICIRDEDHQMNYKIHTIRLISSSRACSIAKSSSSILFYNVNDDYKSLHKLQGYFRFT